MSRFALNLSARRLHISLESDRIALVGIRGHFRPVIEANQLLPTRLHPKSPEAGLATLAEALQEKPWSQFRGANANVVLSDQLVRYFIFETPPGLRNLNEFRQALAARFKQIFGLPPDDWVIEADAHPRSSRSLACAMDKRLLGELRGILQTAGLQTSSLQPFLVQAFNRHRPNLSKRPFWFAAAERESLSLAFINGSHWHGFKAHRMESDVHQILPTLIARNSMLFGVAETENQVWISGVLPSFDEDQDISVLGTRLWPGRDEIWSRDYRLALAGLWP